MTVFGCSCYSSKTVSVHFVVTSYWLVSQFWLSTYTNNINLSITKTKRIFLTCSVNIISMQRGREL